MAIGIGKYDDDWSSAPINTDQIMEKYIIKNSIITPDGTELVSNHVHDYKTHIDKNGKKYSVDGGPYYLKRGGPDDYKENSIYSNTKHEIIRENFRWGTYGKDGDEPLTYILLKDMTFDHINAILNTQKNLKKHFKYIFIQELAYRSKGEPE